MDIVWWLGSVWMGCRAKFIVPVSGSNMNRTLSVACSDDVCEDVGGLSQCLSCATCARMVGPSV